VILFIQPAVGSPEAEYDGDAIVRQCPVCQTESIIGHGRRRKQAHDEVHDWIPIRRGFCNRCGKTVTLLPWFSLPYTHYSLIARSQALRSYFLDCCSLEQAAPLLKDPDRLPAGSTLRRWFRALETSVLCDRVQAAELEPSPVQMSNSTQVAHPSTPFPLLRRITRAVSARLSRGDPFQYGALVLSWRTVAHFLQVLLPLRR
jgi:hypothetical protein